MDMLSDTQTVSQGLYPPDSQDSQEPGTQELMALTGANLVPMPKKVQVSQIYKDFCITKIVCVCVCVCVCVSHTAILIQVAQIQIDYARRAKRLDVKKLKTKMWEVMSEKLTTQVHIVSQ